MLRDLQFSFFFLSLSFFVDNHFIDDYPRFSTLDTKEKSTAVANSMNYMTKKGKHMQKIISKANHWMEESDWGVFHCFWINISSPSNLNSFLMYSPLCPSVLSSSSSYSCVLICPLHQGWPPPTGMVITLFLHIVPSPSHLLFFFCKRHFWQHLDMFVNPPPFFHLHCISQRTQMSNYACDDCVFGSEELQKMC